MIAPYFGNSIYIWGNLIGLIMLALSLGYFIGGKLADRDNNQDFIRNLFGGTAVFLLFDLFIYNFLLEKLASSDIIWGSIESIFILFLFPMILLAAISPLSIKFLSDKEKVGFSSGAIYSWGTIGSLAGTFLTTFVLIPYLGCKLTLFICFLVPLTAFSFFLFLSFEKEKIFLSFFLLFISLFSLPKPALPSDVLLETESIYNQIRLVDRGKIILLTLNSNKAYLTQSGYIKEGTLYDFSLIDLFNLGPSITQVKNLLVLGMSGGSSVRQHQQFSPETFIDAVEIDPKIIQIAKDRFGISESNSLKIYQADARPFLARSDKKYNMVEIDLFQGSPYIPFYILTKEFFDSASNHLSDQGIIMMNLYAPADHELFSPVLDTISSVFPSVFYIPIQNHNYVILASKETINKEEIKKRISDSQEKRSPELAIASNFLLENIEQYSAESNPLVFTDDWTPVEAITHKMLKGVPELN